MKWFKHDSDASNDAKLRRLRHKYGAEGYAIYWYCLELIARNVDEHNLTFELEHDSDLIAEDFRMSSEVVQEMMAYMVNLGLFESSHGVITCMKMLTRTDEYTRKLLAQQRQSTPCKTVSGHTPDTIRIKSVLIEEKRREEKDKGVRKEPRTAFVKPTVEEVSAYCRERKNGIDAEHFVDHYTGNGWKVGANKMADWKAAVRTWEKKRGEFGQSRSAQPSRNELFAGCE